MRIESIERFSGELTKVKAELDSAAAGENVLIACHNAAEVERLGEVFSDTELAQSNRLHLTVGRIRAGFHLIDAQTLVIGDHELFARAEIRRPVTRRRYESRAIDSFLDLNEGDLVVHVNHGIARIAGCTSSTSRPSTPRKPCCSSLPRGPSSMSRSPRSTWFRNTSAAARPNPRSRRSAPRPGKNARSEWPRRSSTWRKS